MNPPSLHDATSNHTPWRAPRYSRGDPGQRTRALAAAIDAAREAGALMRRHWRSPKRVHSTTQHDIKLELDLRCQQRIERRLLRAFPDTAVLGEEGIVGDPDAATRWVVDPIDGTVNFAYGIPHACVSIALQVRPSSQQASAKPSATAAAFTSILGVVYDPFCDELWTGVVGDPARLNGRITRVSRRRRLAEAVVSIGFAKDRESLARMLPVMRRLAPRVRKVRIMGAAALGLAYVASGRMDAYVETGLRLWDIAAGGLILECAGGEFWHQPVGRTGRYRLRANNRLLSRSLLRITT